MTLSHGCLRVVGDNELRIMLVSKVFKTQSQYGPKSVRNLLYLNRVVQMRKR